MTHAKKRLINRTKETKTRIMDRPHQITWVTRSTRDYRVPVFEALDSSCGHRLTVIISDQWTPKRVLKRIREVLGSRAVILSGEKNFGNSWSTMRMANRSISIPYQPGLLKAISETEPDILVGDGFFQWSGPALYYRITRKVPLVICYERTFHTERHAQWFRVLYRRLALKWVDAVCCNGSLSAEYTQSLGFPSARLTTGQMAADVEGLKKRAEAVTAADREHRRKQWRAKGTVFLFVGRFIELKGLRQLIEGWRLFEQEVPGANTLVLVGKGPLEDELRSLVEEYGLREVCFAGPVEYKDIATAYTAADFFVMPTLEDNWSLVVPEAMACGKPALTSKYNGCWPELIQEGRNGWVFDSLDPIDIRRCLVLAIQNQHRLEELGEQSRQIISCHTPERAARSILDACQIAWQHRNG